MAEAQANHRVILAGEEALTLARRGMNAWNEWAAANEGAEVNFSKIDFATAENAKIEFMGFHFPRALSFDKSRFGVANFINARFSGEANFNHAEFGVEARFMNVEFRGPANFNHAEFGVEAGFMNVKFRGPANFCYAEFFAEANFLNAKLKARADFRFANFGGDALFRNAMFGRDTIFFVANFGGKANFEDAWFEAEADFHDAIFKDAARFFGGCFNSDVIFRGVAFEKYADFLHRRFEGQADFSGAQFSGPLILDHANFCFVPDLRRTQIAPHITLHGVGVSCPTKPRWIFFRQAEDDEAADKFRRLKELAIKAADHDRELAFLAGELRAKRFHETTALALIPSYLYEWFSDFGRSISRPASHLLMLWFLCGLLNLSGSWAYPGWQSKLWDALLISAANLLPFLGGAKGVLERKSNLFISGIPAWFDGLALVEGLLSAVLIFLIGLALRNRFRI